MASLPTPRPGNRWLLQITIRAARAEESRWREQLAVLRPVSAYDSATQTRSIFVGSFDVASVQTLQTLCDAARSFGTDIQLQPAPVPAVWSGPSFAGDAEVAALLTADVDKGRPLGQLPTA
ncbi:hypothetical protein ACWDSD_36595 [Streptomyces spiralis]